MCVVARIRNFKPLFRSLPCFNSFGVPLLLISFIFLYLTYSSDSCPERIAFSIFSSLFQFHHSFWALSLSHPHIAFKKPIFYNLYCFLHCCGLITAFI